ncbi:uncharacterized protein LOC119008775 isoform X3 [Acanthopagrus latus]|nr:uncharacterized protein LOC119008775 isoform X3 [Acanthopagrus latus]
MHGVVYYLNFLFWTESARDHADGLLSFKQFPTCYISDVAGQVARHTNNRTRQLYFKQHDGRLCAPTPDNIKLAVNKELQMDMKWVKNLRFPLPLQGSLDGDRVAATHPITGTTERYSLYDRFHQKNQKRPEERLRSLNICPSLRTEINSSVAEQFNRELASVRYSLCQMKEAHFKQTLRVLIDLHNEKINLTFKSEMEALCNTQLSIGLHGMLGLQSAGKEDHKPTVAGTVRSSFQAELYAIDDNDKGKLEDLFSGCRKGTQIITHVSRRFPVTIKDIRSFCPPELLAQSSMVMPWLTDDAVNYRVAQLAQEHTSGSLGTYDFILWHREWTTSGGVSEQVVKCIPVSDKLFLPRIVGHLSPETGNHFILWVFDFKLRQIRVYDSLMLQCQISHGDMDLLRNVFRLSGGLEGWTVTFPSQWKQQDTVNCGVFVCSAAENEALNREVTAEALTLNQCRTLRLHHAAQILKTVNAEDFPRTAEELLKMEKKEIKLQEAEAKKPNSNSHCLAWKLRSCLFQRATGTTSVFHEKIKMYSWVQCISSVLVWRGTGRLRIFFVDATAPLN